MARKPQIHWRANGHGPALLLLNGWSTSGLAWPSAWLRELRRSHRVIRPDNRGTGYSRFAPIPFTIGDLAEDVIDVLDDAGVETATVLGLSMGGMIAQELAIRAPERIDGLVLAGTRPPGPTQGPMLSPGIAWQLMRPAGARGDLAAYFRKLWTAAAAPGFAERSPELVEELVRQGVERPTPRSLMMQQMRAATGWGRPQRLARIQAPTIVVHGLQDPLVDVRHARRLAGLIPGSRLLELPGVGHLVPQEAPDELVECIRTVSGSGRAAAAAVDDDAESRVA